ncbi:dr1-associated corepressor homolog [Cydia fagiglandana]|uniref:dr1-associated corepressor homolog n=1 Tax=Cydia fagiglandana TaxID=1458189 RepID=UPI002FEE2AE5
MPSKKRKYNARFPAGRIKKIMQTDEEVGKVAQAVPIIISRTLELFVESLLSKALQVTTARNAKTLSPSHVKQCILAESRFDFLKDLVANIPDVSAAEEKEMMSAEDSPNSSRFSDSAPRRLAREDSNSSSSSEVRPRTQREMPRSISLDPEIHRHRHEPTSTIVSTDTVMDLSKKSTEPKVRANFYQETLPDEVQQTSVITPNPTYAQPSTSNFVPKDVPKPTKFYVDVPIQNNNTPVTPILNIDFSKSLAAPEIKVLSPLEKPRLQRQNSKQHKEVKKFKPPIPHIDIDLTGNLQIDEDYDT